MSARCLDPACDALRRKIESFGCDIDEDGRCAKERDCFGSRREGEGWAKHGVAAPHAERHQRD